MKTWGKTCICLIFLLTFIIFIVSLLINFMKSNITIDENGSTKLQSGFEFIKENGLWTTMKYLYSPLSHSKIDEMFNPRWFPDPTETKFVNYTPGILYFSSGINLLLVAFPIFLIISIIITIKMKRKMNYPIPDYLKELKVNIKKDKKRFKKGFKIKMKNKDINKDLKNEYKIEFQKNMFEIKKANTEVKYKINENYKIQKKNIKINNTKSNNNV